LIIIFIIFLILINSFTSQFIIIGKTSYKEDYPDETREVKPKRIILIGWDGVHRNRLYDIMRDPKEMLNLKNLSNEGNFVETVVTSGATDTKAGWTEILTGYDPDYTGVYSNSNFQSIPKGYTIFERLNERFGNESVFTIMVTGKADNVGSEPGYPYHNVKRYIDRHELDIIRKGEKVWPLAKSHLEEYMMNHSDEHLFAFILFHEPDHNGHYLGEDSLNYTNDIKTDDYYLGLLIDWLKEQEIYNDTLIYVTTDHGYDETTAPFPVDLKKPGQAHKMAPYTFLSTNDPTIIRNGDRKDIGPTILTQFGINLSKINPPLSGTPLMMEKEPMMIDKEIVNVESAKHILLISWSGVQRNHLEEMLARDETLPHLKGIIDDGRYVEIYSTHLHKNVSNISLEKKLFGTDTTCGSATLLTGYDPDLTSIYCDNRFGIIPKRYTIFERLKAILPKNNLTNLMITGRDKEEGGGEVPYQNAKRSIDNFHINITPSDVGPNTLEYLDNINTEYLFGFIHFSYPDLAGHEFGENSLEYEAAIEQCDYWLGEIIEKLKDLDIYDETLLYVTSSHGFDEESAKFPIEPKNPGHNHTIGPYTFLATNDKSIKRHGNQRDIAPTILSKYGLNLTEINPQLEGDLLTSHNIHYFPIASIYANRTNGTSPFTIQFIGNAFNKDGTLITFSWDFGDGNASNKTELNHTFTVPGIYNVTLIVTDDSNLTGMDNIMISVSPVDKEKFKNSTLKNDTSSNGINPDDTDNSISNIIEEVGLGVCWGILVSIVVIFELLIYFIITNNLITIRKSKEGDILKERKSRQKTN
jgi:predicted AlkP superfamily pyrophosphatase or phosphodiesterase